MEYFILFLSAVYAAIVANFLNGYLPPRFNKYITYTTLIVFGLFAGVVANLQITIPLAYMFGYVMLFIVIVMLYKTDFLKPLFAAGSFIIHMLGTRGITVTIMSLVTRHSLFFTVTNDELNKTAIILMYLLIIGELIIFQIIYPKKKLGTLIETNYVNALAYLTLSFDILLIVKSYFYYYEIPYASFSLYNLFFEILFLSSFYFCFDYFLSKAESQAKARDIDLLENQLEQQIQLYNNQESYITGLRRFKHDYLALVQGLDYLIQNKEYDRISPYLKSSLSVFSSLTGSYKTYSDHVIIQGVLFDLSSSCQKDNIEFEGNIMLNGVSLSLNDLDICRLFKNVANNAYEACARDEVTAKKTIKVSLVKKSKWLAITFENTFDGVVIKSDPKNDLKFNSRKNGPSHGYGLTNVKSVVEGVNGYLNIETIENPSIFRLTIMLPSYDA